MTFSITRLFHYAECHCAECPILFTIILNIIMLSVVMLSVVAPHEGLHSANTPAFICAVAVAVRVCSLYDLATVVSYSLTLLV